MELPAYEVVRRTPLGRLDAEDYRVLLLQQVGVAVLLPRALTQLEREPLWEGDYIPGASSRSSFNCRNSTGAHPDRLGKLSPTVVALGDADELKAMGAARWTPPRRVDDFHYRVEA